MGWMRGVRWLVTLAGCSFYLPGGSELDAPVVRDAPVDAPVDAFLVPCPITYGQLGPTATASSYRLVDRASAGANWVTAELDCRDDGPRTHLAIAETAAEHVIFEDAVSGASLWLGVTDRKVDVDHVAIPALLGDPGRNYFPKQGVEKCAAYSVQTTRDLEDRDIRETGVYRLLRGD